MAYFIHIHAHVFVRIFIFRVSILNCTCLIKSRWVVAANFTWIILFYTLFFNSREILRAYNIPMDIFTIALFIFNFGVTGMVCIHWKGPIRVNQAYLIFIAALMALIFIKYLPEWTTWVVLFAISIWGRFGWYFC